MAQKRRTYREREAEQNDGAVEGRKPAAFSPEHLTTNLSLKYDVIIRLAPEWELEFVFPLRKSMGPYSSDGKELPAWLSLSLIGRSGERITPEIKRIHCAFTMNVVCQYMRGGVAIIGARTPVRLKLTVPGAGEITHQCSLRKWRKK